MINKKKAVLLVNLGTPDSSSVKDVRKFLKEFLSDPLVVDVPFLVRWLLVNCIIVPFRGPKSAAEYKLLWTERGSPLKFHSIDMLERLTEQVNDKYQLALSMRYQSPSIREGLEELRKGGCEQLLILPLFPQYAGATTQSIFDKVSEELATMEWNVDTKLIKSFETDSNFIQAILNKSKLLDEQSFDHTLFSYHGLPERQLKNENPKCLIGNCCDNLTDNNKYCYKAQCYATTRALVKELNLEEGDYTVCFQSRQGNIPWISPYIEDEIEKLAEQGIKNIRVFSPAFVADCLETTIEIADTYKNLFIELGGDNLTLVESLNSSDDWIKALKSMIDTSFEENALEEN
ncbi:MAG: ferrochelatase [Enterobacterales bacterium]